MALVHSLYIAFHFLQLSILFISCNVGVHIKRRMGFGFSDYYRRRFRILRKIATCEYLYSLTLIVFISV